MARRQRRERDRTEAPGPRTTPGTEGVPGAADSAFPPQCPLQCPPLCPLCGRPIPPDVPQSLHHLVPRSRGGKGGPVVLLHHICHKEIHASLSESELARRFSSIEALRAHPRLARFIAWVADRPPGFLSRVPRGRTGRRG